MKDTTATMPESWTSATIGEICTALQYGYTASASDEPCGPRLLRITDIQNGLVQWLSVPYCQIESEQIHKYQLHPGDIVFARTGGTVGKSFIISSVPESSVFASYLIRLSAHPNVEPKYLYHFFQTASYWEQIGLKKGGLQGNVNATTLSSLELPICPLNEQHRIIAKIEELFSELDKGIENLKTAQAQLKVYRQALLKHAFEGKLTAQWRAENQDKLETAAAFLKRIQQERKSPSVPLFQRGKTTSTAASVPPFEKGGLGGISDHPPLQKGGRGDLKPKASKSLPPLTAEELAELPELPEGWGWCKLGDFIVSIDAGKSFKCDEREPRANEIGVAKVSAVTWGEYDESESKTCTDTSKENDAYLIQSGDFILSRANTIDLVGACVIARRVTKKIMLSDKTLRIKFDGLSQEYFLQYLGSRFGRKQIMQLSTGNQESMRNIGQERIRSIAVPICSGAESEVVIESLAARLSEIDQLDQTITTSLQQAEALRQSILKKAFSGQLVAQDPHDEPASALLARIKAERAEIGNNAVSSRRIKKVSV